MVHIRKSISTMKFAKVVLQYCTWDCKKRFINLWQLGTHRGRGKYFFCLRCSCATACKPQTGLSWGRGVCSRRKSWAWCPSSRRNRWRPCGRGRRRRSKSREKGSHSGCRWRESSSAWPMWIIYSVLELELVWLQARVILFKANRWVEANLRGHVKQNVV